MIPFPILIPRSYHKSHNILRVRVACSRLLTASCRMTRLYIVQTQYQGNGKNEPPKVVGKLDCCFGMLFHHSVPLPRLPSCRMSNPRFNPTVFGTTAIIPIPSFPQLSGLRIRGANNLATSPEPKFCELTLQEALWRTSNRSRA